MNLRFVTCLLGSLASVNCRVNVSGPCDQGNRVVHAVNVEDSSFLYFKEFSVNKDNNPEDYMSQTSSEDSYVATDVLSKSDDPLKKERSSLYSLTYDTCLQYIGIFCRDIDVLKCTLGIMCRNNSYLNSIHKFVFNFVPYTLVWKNTYSMISSLSELKNNLFGGFVKSNDTNSQIKNNNGTDESEEDNIGYHDPIFSFDSLKIKYTSLIKPFISGLLPSALCMTGKFNCFNALNTSFVVNNNVELFSNKNINLFFAFFCGTQYLSQYMYGFNFSIPGILNNIVSYLGTRALYFMWKTSFNNFHDTNFRNMKHSNTIFALHTLAYTAKYFYYGFWNRYVIYASALVFLSKSLSQYFYNGIEYANELAHRVTLEFDTQREGMNKNNSIMSQSFNAIEKLHTNISSLLFGFPIVREQID